VAQDLVRIVDEDEGELAPQFLRHVFDVAFVPGRQDDGSDPRPVPRSVISPVMARSLRTGRRVASEARAVTMVTPAEGPSFGMAPAGTCT